MLPIELQKHQAIQATIEGNWKLAITINEVLLEKNSLDIETLNRLAFAYTVTGQITQAKNAYKKVLEIDPLNPIALKNLKRLKNTASSITNHTTTHLFTNMFIEENGKTKIVLLINTAPSKIIQSLQVGQSLQFCVKRLKIFVLDNEEQYIGMLPDDISKRLIKFIDGGNLYEVYIKSIESNTVSIFIREKKRSHIFKDQATFIAGEKHEALFKKGSIKK